MQGKHILLIDQHNFYQVDPKTGQHFVYKGKYIKCNHNKNRSKLYRTLFL
jgi:hypothetical protein